MTVVVEGKAFPVTILRKRMKRMIMRFRDDTFFISVPKHAPLSWIKNQLNHHALALYQKVTTHQHTPYNQEGIYLLGQWYLWSALPKTFPALKLTQSPTWPTSQIGLKQWFLPLLTSRVRHYEQRLNIQKPYRVRLRQMRSRLGSNARQTHALTLALKLIHFAWPIIDAVIVHELIHDQHFHHQPSFYQALLKAYPRYYEEHGKILKGQYR